MNKIYKDILEVLDTDRTTFDDVMSNKSNYYFSYPIRKRSGKKRYLDAPHGILKDWQNKILYNVLYRYGAHPIAYGFAKGKNPVLAAQQHVGKDILVALDIKDFFSSIKEEQLIQLFYRLHYNTKNSTIWGPDKAGYTHIRRKEIEQNNQDLIKILTYKGMLPQGAPTSPAVSNLYMLAPDKMLSRLAKIHDATITRYADDIVFSANNEPKLPDKIIPVVKNILNRYDLYANPRKTHVNRKNKRMRVVGIVVNEKTNIPRESWRRFRAKLHNLKTLNTPITQEEAQKIRGQIEWIKTVNPPRGEQFLKEYGLLNFLAT
jgi:hypothetical protein